MVKQYVAAQSLLKLADDLAGGAAYRVTLKREVGELVTKRDEANAGIAAAEQKAKDIIAAAEARILAAQTEANASWQDAINRKNDVQRELDAKLVEVSAAVHRLDLIRGQAAAITGVARA
jgi:hypothetical protein